MLTIFAIKMLHSLLTITKSFFLYCWKCLSKVNICSFIWSYIPLEKIPLIVQERRRLPFKTKRPSYLHMNEGDIDLFWEVWWHMKYWNVPFLNIKTTTISLQCIPSQSLHYKHVASTQYCNDSITVPRVHTRGCLSLRRVTCNTPLSFCEIWTNVCPQNELRPKISRANIANTSIK